MLEHAGPKDQSFHTPMPDKHAQRRPKLHAPRTSPTPLRSATEHSPQPMRKAQEHNARTGLPVAEPD